MQPTNHTVSRSKLTTTLVSGTISTPSQSRTPLQYDGTGLLAFEFRASKAANASPSQHGRGVRDGSRLVVSSEPPVNLGLEVK